MRDNSISLIDRLVEERHRKGMTQKELAVATGLAQAAIGRLESKKAVPQLDTLLKVADALECELLLVPADKAEDVEDLLAYHQAMAEHRKNPRTYSVDEIEACVG